MIQNDHLFLGEYTPTNKKRFSCSDSTFLSLISLHYTWLWLMITSFQIRKLVCEWMAWALRMSRPGKEISREALMRKAQMRDAEARGYASVSLISNVKDVDNAIPLNDFAPMHALPLKDGGYINVRNELLAILNELRYITHKIKEDEETAESTNDWKFAAMVIDRFCIWVFSLLMLVTTIPTFISAATKEDKPYAG